MGSTNACCECDAHGPDAIETGPALLGSQKSVEVVQQIAILIEGDDNGVVDAEGTGSVGKCMTSEGVEAEPLTGNASATKKTKRSKRPIPLASNCLSNQSGSSWSTTPCGSLQHEPTGTTLVSTAEVGWEHLSYTVSREDISIDSVIARGASGIVELARHKVSGQEFAIKTMKVASKELRQQMLHDIQGLVATGGSPHVVRLFCGYMDSGKIGLILEFMDRGCLAKLQHRIRVGSIPVRILANIARQIVNGLHYIHARAILHRDIKPGNILHNSIGDVKLTDFGLSKSFKDLQDRVTTTPIGTRIYMSPERVAGEDYSFAADVWSMGVVVFELAATHPYPCTSVLELSQKLTDEPEPRLDPHTYSDSLCDFIKITIVRDTTSRAVAESLIAHPYVCSNYATRQEFVDWLLALDNLDAERHRLN